MKNLPVGESEPIKALSEQRIQRVVKAFMSHPKDKKKCLEAIEAALEQNAKERQSEVQEEGDRVWQRVSQSIL